MRVALISDIHGNDVALEAVLADVKVSGADQTICLGDVATLGPDPSTTIQRLSAEGCPVVMGNHDDFLLHPERVDGYTESATVRRSIAWGCAQVTADDLVSAAAYVVDTRIGDLLARH